MTTGRKKVLIVEDELLTARLLQMELQSWGLEVPKPEAKGEEAVRTALRIKPNLILMDIRLAGGMDGIEAARAILNHQNTAILFMTGYDIDLIKQRASDLKVVGFVPKPVDMDYLRRIIENLV
ncbi:MAG: response regulator [candidate division KSB1 bacterium]|nr:response regulator [candidate division KSB1 bacterium]